jgi:hypothetical protein
LPRFPDFRENPDHPNSQGFRKDPKYRCPRCREFPNTRMNQNFLMCRKYPTHLLYPMSRKCHLFLISLLYPVFPKYRNNIRNILVLKMNGFALYLY